MSDSTFTLTVSQLTQAIKLHLEQQFPSVMVQGEISNFKKQSSGHLYFTLKDQKAQIQCAMFAPNARFLKQLPKDGDQVKISGEINVYPPRGNYQIIVRTLAPAGLGELLMLLEKRKEKFKNLGYFDSGIKKTLPEFPKTIGIVTSPTGAVIRDILHILNRRAHGYHVLINPVKVQGEGAAEEISRAIDDFNRYSLADVVIVARGGGSLEDLWPFNEEIVVESVFKSRLPIVSAVGHETDTTLCDLAADVRAPTPSAAAELVLAEKEAHMSFLKHCQEKLDQALKLKLQRHKEQLALYQKNAFFQSPYRLLELFSQKLDDVQWQIDQKMERKLSFLKEKVYEKKYYLQTQNPDKKIQEKKFFLKSYMQKLDFKMSQTLQIKKNNFENLWTHLSAIDPKKLLKKGYSIVYDEKQKRAIVSAKDIALKQKLKLILTDGTLDAVVEHVHLENDETKRSSV